MESSNARVKAVRKEFNLTQTEFGERIGLTRRGVQNVEAEGGAVTEQTKIAICRTFNVNREWLETGRGDIFLKSYEDQAEEVAREHNLGRGGTMLLKAVAKIFAEQGEEAMLHVIDNVLVPMIAELNFERSRALADKLKAEYAADIEDLRDSSEKKTAE